MLRDGSKGWYGQETDKEEEEKAEQRYADNLLPDLIGHHISLFMAPRTSSMSSAL